MADIPKIGAGPDAGLRNIEMRFTMREMLVLHSALKGRHEDLAKEAWWIEQRGDAAKAALLNDQAGEQRDLADRLFEVLRGMMDTKR